MSIERRVLVVEDSPVDRRLLMRALNNAIPKMIATECSSLTEAVNSASDSAFDVCLLDLNLDDSAGIDTLRTWMEQVGSIPTVVLTGSDDAKLDSACLSLGAQDYLSKDEVSVKALRRTIRHSIERFDLNQKLVQAATTDSLTGLPNRRSLFESLNKMVERSKRYNRKVAVIYIDVDHFKSINDEHGHAIGDAVLSQLGERLSQSMRSTDEAGRIGGDEFVVLAEEAEEEWDLEAIYRRLTSNLESPITTDAGVIYPSVSLGRARFPTDAQTPEGLLDTADRDMYRQKSCENGQASGEISDT